MGHAVLCGLRCGGVGWSEQLFGDVLVVDGGVGFDLDEDVVEFGEVLVEFLFDEEEDFAGLLEAHVGVEGDMEVEFIKTFQG